MRGGCLNTRKAYKFMHFVERIVERARDGGKKVSRTRRTCLPRVAHYQELLRPVHAVVVVGSVDRGANCDHPQLRSATGEIEQYAGLPRTEEISQILGPPGR